MQQYYKEENIRLIKEKKSIEKEIAEYDKRQEQWFELTSETFDFACTAQYQFETGDVKTKTYILSKLGSNLTILNRELYISGDKPYYLIEKGKKEIAANSRIVRTCKKGRNSRPIALLRAY